MLSREKLDRAVLKMRPTSFLLHRYFPAASRQRARVSFHNDPTTITCDLSLGRQRLD